MVTANDAGVNRRALMYNDSAVCPHEGVPIEEWLPGVNPRSSRNDGSDRSARSIVRSPSLPPPTRQSHTVANAW